MTESRSGFIGRIPVRNLWLLMLYASDLFRQLNQSAVAIEDNPDDIPDLIAEILAHVAEKRLRRNLSLGYRRREAVLRRVRGRILSLQTWRRQLLSRGQVACRFEELTVDTPRNRFVCSALLAISQKVQNPGLARRCRSLAGSFRAVGVSAEQPDRFEIDVDRFGRHDSEDRFMVAVAKLAFQLALPTETPGQTPLGYPGWDIVWMRKLYERALAGFYDVVLSPRGWKVIRGHQYQWQISRKSDGIDAILPSMRTDIILERPESASRIIIDTKFNEIVAGGWYRDEAIRSGYMYQLYAYLRSQECALDPLSQTASGVLLHPSVGKQVDEAVEIQNHVIRFATVDLSQGSREIRDQLLRIVEEDVASLSTC